MDKTSGVQVIFVMLARSGYEVIVSGFGSSANKSGSDGIQIHNIAFNLGTSLL
jgi:hypothetical protein